MPQHLFRAAGYLVVFLPFGLLIAGAAIDRPYLTAAVILGLGPLTRIAFGNVASDLPEWDEKTGILLDWLPASYAAAFPILVIWFLSEVHANPPRSTTAWFWMGLSLWTCLFFAVVVAHELVHRSGRRRRVGWLLAGAAGYPWFAHEHLRHHSTSGNVALAEWPRRSETLWTFVVRRTVRSVRSALECNAIAAARQKRSALHGGLPEAFVAMAITALAFATSGGAAGLLLYVLVAAGVHFGVQAVTYLQHWGLGVDSVLGADEGRYAWEDRCQFQVWLMLHLALHHAHHQNSALPYYHLAPHRDSPRLPAGYVLLLLVSFFPPVWRWLMEPALDAWIRDPSAHVEPQRWRLVCLPGHFAPKASL